MAGVQLDAVEDPRAHQDDGPYGPRQLYELRVEHDHGRLRTAVEQHAPVPSALREDADRRAYHESRDTVEAVLQDEYGPGVRISGRPFNQAAAPDPVYVWLPDDAPVDEAEALLNDYIEA